MIQRFEKASKSIFGGNNNSKDKMPDFWRRLKTSFDRKNSKKLHSWKDNEGKPDLEVLDSWRDRIAQLCKLRETRPPDFVE